MLLNTPCRSADVGASKYLFGLEAMVCNTVRARVSVPEGRFDRFRPIVYTTVPAAFAAAAWLIASSVHTSLAVGLVAHPGF
jgi:hypothetical protein